MYDISINLYKTFCVVAQSKNYVDASNKLHISTTAISKNIRQLESLLGTTLFYREKDRGRLRLLSRPRFIRFPMATEVKCPIL